MLTPYFHIDAPLRQRCRHYAITPFSFSLIFCHYRHAISPPLFRYFRHMPLFVLYFIIAY
jgi:hypothetical protein